MLTRQAFSFYASACTTTGACSPCGWSVRLLLGSGILSLLLGVVSPPAFAAPPLVKAQEIQYVPGRLLIQQRAGLSDAEVDKALKPHGGKRVGKIRGINVHVVQLPPQANARAVAALLAKNKHFKYVEQDQILAPAGTTNDPSLPSQWHLTKIGAQAAWDTSTGSEVIIAILDTGVDASHPDLAAQLIPGWNIYDNNSDSSDIHGHGTAVAGTAAAAGHNAIGVASVAYRAKLMPVRIADPSGYAYFSTMASGLTWAADHGARVANISYENVANSSTVESAAQYFKSKGGLTVVCAGNSGALQTVGASANLVVVSATDSSDAKTSWSNYGIYVDIAAPGQSILTTSRGGGYGQWSGTSFSSPIVAGTAALMMAANPALPSDQVQSYLYSTSVDLGAVGKDDYYGAGRVDAARATLAAATATASDMQAPAVAIAAPIGGKVLGLVAVDVVASDNVGVTRVDLVVNGSNYATDTIAPYGFSWDSSAVADGPATLIAYAYDAAGNYTGSQPVSVTVANIVAEADTTSPVLAFTSPANGARVSKVVTISSAATDNLGPEGITQSLYIDGELSATASGSSLSTRWNTKKVSAGNHVLMLTATDAAGNSSSVSIGVVK